MPASDYICVQLVSTAIFVVCPADDHISSVGEGELLAFMLHCAWKQTETLRNKGRRRDKWKTKSWRLEAPFCSVYCVANCVEYLVRHLISHLERFKCKTQHITQKPQLQNRWFQPAFSPLLGYLAANCVSAAEISQPAKKRGANTGI